MGLTPLEQRRYDELRLKELEAKMQSSQTPQRQGDTALDSLGRMAKSGLVGTRSALESMTFGLSEPVISGLGAPILAARRAIESKDIGELGPEGLKKSYQDLVETRRQEKQDYNIADIAGQIGGAFVPGSLAAKGIGAVEKGISPLISKGADVLSKVPGAKTGLVKGVGRIAESGIRGAAGAGAYEAARQSVEIPTGFLKKEEAPEITDVMTSGARFGAGLRTIPEAIKGAGYLGKKGITTFLGPSEKTINEYLARSEEINQAKTVGEIKDKIDEIITSMADDVSQGKLKISEAKNTLNQMELGYVQGKFDIHSQMKDAQSKLDRALTARKEQLQAVKAPLHLGQNIVEDIGELQSKVSKGSGESYDILEKSKAQISLSSSMKELIAAHDSLNIAGGPPVTQEAISAQQKIQSLLQTVGRLPAKISGVDAKKLLRQIDDTEKVLYASGEFNDAIGKAHKAVRRTVDSALKGDKQYAAKMKEVSANAQLLEKIKKRFGDINQAISKLSSVGRETSQEDVKLLGELGKITGRDYLKEISAYQKAQSTLKSPSAMRQIESELPEFAPARKLELEHESLRNPQTKRGFLSKETNNIDDLSQKLAEAEARQAPFSGLSPKTSEQNIRRLMTESPEKNIELRKTMGLLGERGSQDFVKDIENRRLLDAFEKGNVQGSRNVNAWSFILSSVGTGAVGMVTGGPLGLTVGAMVGGAIDRFGPQMAKGILDGYLAISKNPTMQNINKLNLSPEAKQYLINQLSIQTNTGLLRGGAQ